VAPTLIQESGLEARPIEDKRAELAAVDGGQQLSADEVQAIRAIGDNTGCMTLKGASLDHVGAPLADRWQLDEELAALACRWSIDPRRDLSEHAAVGQ
jgi:Ser/Thr protein kinase RdoA (MazF antagonist)